MYQRPHIPSSNSIDKPYRFLRLPLDVDPSAFLAELESVQPHWLSGQWKWHIRTFFCVLRGGPEGTHPGSSLTSGTGVDTPILKKLPKLSYFLDKRFPVPVSLAWLGLSPSDSCIYLHIDNKAHWDLHHRIHVPLKTSSAARLCVEEGFLHLPTGAVWAFNNSRPHGAINLGPPRLHLILDLPDTLEIRTLLASGKHEEGQIDTGALERLQENPFDALTDAERQNKYLMARLKSQ